MLTVNPIAALLDPPAVKADAGGGGDAFAPLIAPLLTPAEPPAPGKPLPIAGEMLPIETPAPPAAALLPAPSRFALAEPGEPAIFVPPTLVGDAKQPVAPEPKARAALLTTSAFAAPSTRPIRTPLLSLAEPGEPDAKKTPEVAAESAPAGALPPTIQAPPPAIVPQPMQSAPPPDTDPVRAEAAVALAAPVSRHPGLAPGSRFPLPPAEGVHPPAVTPRPTTVAAEPARTAHASGAQIGRAHV